MRPTEEGCKLIAPLDPPVDSIETESLWAVRHGDNLYRITNVPFFLYNLNLDDIVRCEGELYGLPKIVKVMHRSGKETLRVFISAQATESVRTEVIQFLTDSAELVEPAGNGLFAASFRIWPDLEKAVKHINLTFPEELVSYESGYHANAQFWDGE